MIKLDTRYNVFQCILTGENLLDFNAMTSIVLSTTMNDTTGFVWNEFLTCSENNEEIAYKLDNNFMKAGRQTNKVQKRYCIWCIKQSTRNWVFFDVLTSIIVRSVHEYRPISQQMGRKNNEHEACNLKFNFQETA